MANFLDTLMGLNDRPNAPVTPPIALTIAGSDSGGGAGIQADIKTFSALGVHATSALTLVTAQNTKGVQAIEMLSVPLVRAQLKALRTDLPAVATKTGALGSEAMIQAIVEWLQDHPIENLVVDPVMVSKHGDPLLPERAQRILRDRLLEHALLITPNCFEAAAMTQRDVGDLASMKEAAKRLFDHGPKLVLIKGSQLDRIVRDIVYDGTGFIEFGADRIRTTRLHGSGCVFSATITARLAHGDSPLAAIEFAREFISGAIERAPALGSGVAPVHPLHEIW
jgi:hydroxymethylpyrimidine/phosphomethylpyrimidine kinase